MIKIQPPVPPSLSPPLARLRRSELIETFIDTSLLSLSYNISLFAPFLQTTHNNRGAFTVHPGVSPLDMTPLWYYFPSNNCRTPEQT
jgi:hypothetical protein